MVFDESIIVIFLYTLYSLRYGSSQLRVRNLKNRRDSMCPKNTCPKNTFQYTYDQARIELGGCGGYSPGPQVRWGLIILKTFCTFFQIVYVINTEDLFGWSESLVMMYTTAYISDLEHQITHRFAIWFKLMFNKKIERVKVVQANTSNPLYELLY